jgi:hypothetical protein
VGTSALTKRKVKSLIEKEVAKQIANATGPPGPPGADGADGADGAARAYAYVDPDTRGAPPGPDACTPEHARGVTEVTRVGWGLLHNGTRDQRGDHAGGGHA